MTLNFKPGSPITKPKHHTTVPEGQSPNCGECIGGGRGVELETVVCGSRSGPAKLFKFPAKFLKLHAKFLKLHAKF